MPNLEGKRFTAQGQLRIDLAKGDGGSKTPTFEMVAYTGDALVQAFSEYPIVVDLEGLSIPERAIPIRLDHTIAQGVGHANDVGVVEKGGLSQLEARGMISRATPAARDVIESARNDFPWQSSISADIFSIEEVMEGSVTVNGRTFQAPILVARRSELLEISFVDLGADDNTRARVAASRAKEGNTMPKKQTTGSDSGETSSTENTTTPKETVNAAANNNSSGGGVLEDLDALGQRAQIKASRHRRIKAAAEKAIDQRPELADTVISAAKEAITDDTDPSDFSLAMLQLSRDIPNVSTHRGDAAVSDKVIEAALCQAGGLGDEQLTKSYTEQTLEAAHKHYRGTLGLADAMLVAARANGFHGLSVRSDLEGVLRAAFPERGSMRIEASSTVSLPEILSNTANKFLRRGYDAVERECEKITDWASARDFKPTSNLTLTGDYTFKRLGRDGEIQHGKPGEEKFGNQIDTFARMLSITRQHLYDDDLGALTKIPGLVGRGGALAWVEDFWSVWLDDATFFTEARNNLITGADVPWYLMAKPSVLPVIEASFLNNKRVPTVETAQADFNNLGIQMRGFYDFGNEKQNWRGAVKSHDALDVDSLEAAQVKLLSQKDPHGKPLGLAAGDLLLVVPLNYKFTAEQLVSSAEIRDPAATSSFGTANPHRGKFTVVCSQYLPTTTE